MSFPSFNLLPLELLQLISYKLPLGTLSACKELSKIYDDNWYNNYCEYNYGMKGDKNLYYKSMRTGTIYKTDYDKLENEVKLNIKGIKASGVRHSSKTLILTFDGKLYMDDELIDVDVSDIDYSCYIKKNVCYYFVYENYKKEHHVLDENDNFIKLLGAGDQIILLTSKYVHKKHARKDPVQKYEHNNITDIQLICGNICSLHSNGDVKIIGSEETLFTDVKSIGKSSIIMKDGNTYILYERKGLGILKYNILFEKAMRFRSVLVDGYAFYIKHNNFLKTYHYSTNSDNLNLACTVKNIKDFFLGINNTYLIKNSD